MRQRASQMFEAKERHVRRVKAMFDDDASIESIARAIGAPADWVSRTIARNGWQRVPITAGDRPHKKRKSSGSGC